MIAARYKPAPARRPGRRRVYWDRTLSAWVEPEPGNPTWIVWTYYGGCWRPRAEAREYLVELKRKRMARASLGPLALVAA